MANPDTPINEPASGRCRQLFLTESSLDSSPIDCWSNWISDRPSFNKSSAGRHHRHTKLIKLIALQVVILGAIATPATAQFYPPIVLDSSLTKFFDPDCAFTASVEFIRRGPNGNEADRWPVRVSIRDGMTRVEMDITKARSAHPAQSGEVWKEYVESMKTAGSAEAISIFNPAKRSAFIILPRLKSYVQTALPADAADQLKKRPKSEKVEVGREDIDGHACIKYKVTFDKKSMDVWRTWETPVAFVWSAKEFSNCPLRIDVMDSVGATNATLFIKDIDRKPPDARLFDAPKDFTKCDDEQALMKRIMEKWPKDK
jgi:hypothetical protein